MDQQTLELVQKQMHAMAGASRWGVGLAVVALVFAIFYVFVSGRVFTRAGRPGRAVLILALGSATHVGPAAGGGSPAASAA